ncbi:MAG: hypothetical protein IPK58_17555 [Acidobacteria bacterium]|nr:hypothetical protein [Acidobacteriota bacterium]
MSIQFIGEYKEQNRNSKFEPEINIYSIPEFRESLSKSTEYVKEFDRELEKIKHLASDQFSVANGELPFLPFIDAEKELNVHLKRVSFKSGNGFFYLTQFNNEPSIINNDGLVYVFQGVTNDNQYYILATFPVRTKILPEGYDASEFQGYKLPEFFYERKKHKRNQVNYRNYVSKMGKLLEELESDQFSPSLSLIEEVQSSLEINY